MKKELAEKLYLIGFKPKYGFRRLYDTTDIFIQDIIPELLIAIGDDFESLTKVEKQNKWWAERRGNWADGEKIFSGETPEEALANLYIAINEK